MVYPDDPLETSRYAVIRWFRLDTFVPETAVTSHWISSKHFLAIRTVSTLYSTIVLWSNIGWHATAGTMQSSFTYFSMLTFIGLHAYLVTALYHHVRYFINYTTPQSFFSQPAILNYLFYYLYHSILVFNIITPAIHWSFLAGLRGEEIMMNSNLRIWINTSVHGVSLAMMMIEMILCRIKMQIRMVILILANVALYMFLVFANYASRHIWVYPILSWDRGPVAVGIYFGMGAAFVAVFFLQVFFHYVRDDIAKRKCCCI